VGVVGVAASGSEASSWRRPLVLLLTPDNVNDSVMFAQLMEQALYRSDAAARCLRIDPTASGPVPPGNYAYMVCIVSGATWAPRSRFTREMAHR
jgi:hypothetical protein